MTLPKCLKNNHGTLTLDQRLESGCPPEELTIREIARLWATTNGQLNEKLREQLEQLLEAAAESGELRVDWETNYPANCLVAHPPVGLSEDELIFYVPVEAGIKRDDLQEWIELQGDWPLPFDVMLAQLWGKMPNTSASLKEKPRTPAQIRKDRAIQKAIQIKEEIRRKENREPTIDEIMQDPILLAIWGREKPKESYLRRILEGKVETKRGPRKTR